MMKLGIVGWRGMVGQVLIERMKEARDFKNIESTFFSTSQSGEKNPIDVANTDPILRDAYDLGLLKKMDIILSCQGGEYTLKVHKSLRSEGFKGFWIDAASTLRMESDSIIVLDPINKLGIENALLNHKKDFIGGNCTVSLMMLALGGLFQNNLIEWITSMTYQAASGAGAKNMNELLQQMKYIVDRIDFKKENLSEEILSVEKNIRNQFLNPDFPKTCFGHPLAFNLLPWIDSELPNGQSKEEWKAEAEANKILENKNNPILIDGTCVRIGAMRSHSQGLTIKLKQNVPLDEITGMIKEHNEWVSLVPNNKEESLNNLTPAFTSGTLKIPIGRLRKMSLGENYLNAFTVGDQLLWGAAEPLRRMLQFILNEK